MNIRKGSVTVFLSLMLSLMTAMICSGIESARMAAARTQILNGMDIGLYSLFAGYDRGMLEDYDLFVLNGQSGSGEMDLASVCNTLEEYMKPVLGQNSQKLRLEQSGLTGYRLLTDGNGEAFYKQVVAYMKETIGSQGLQILMDRMKGREEKTKEAQSAGERANEKDSVGSYEAEMDSAARKSQQAAQEQEAAAQENAQFGDGSSPALDSIPTAPAEPVDNPITVIRRIMRMGALQLVLPEGKGVSGKTVQKRDLVSGRRLQQGMELYDGFSEDNTYSSQLLFQQYLMDRLGNYHNPGSSGLHYQIEYILEGKNSDLDNLKAIAGKLLLIREGVNMACLAADTGKRMQAEALAVAIASGFLIPPAAAPIEAALLFCWSFAESVLDVRELFAGGKVPLVKSPSDWQISLENLSSLLEGLDSMRRGAEKGMSYEDYLHVLLMAKSKKEKVMRSMDMMELAVRNKGRSGFRLDCCICALEAFADVRANRRKTFQVIRQYSY